ncbi:MAG: hypothetical protein Q8Q60_00495 [Candidatus Chromulinivorax sp.]|nr:hypothetical protein [Candidatus Chromulinivorax sp.]
MKCLRSFLLLSCLTICAIELQATGKKNSPNKMSKNELVSNLSKEREQRRRNKAKNILESTLLSTDLDKQSTHTSANEQNNASNNDTPTTPVSAKREFSVENNSPNEMNDKELLQNARRQEKAQSFLSNDHNDQPTQEANEFKEPFESPEANRNNHSSTLTKSPKITYVLMTSTSSRAVEQEEPKRVHCIETTTQNNNVSDDTTDDSQQENHNNNGVSESDRKIWWSTFINSKSLEVNPTTINHIRHALGYNIIEKADNNNSDNANTNHETSFYDNDEQTRTHWPINDMTAQQRLMLCIATMQSDFNKIITWIRGKQL